MKNISRHLSLAVLLGALSVAAPLAAHAEGF